MSSRAETTCRRASLAATYDATIRACVDMTFYKSFLGVTDSVWRASYVTAYQDWSWFGYG